MEALLNFCSKRIHRKKNSLHLTWRYLNGVLPNPRRRQSTYSVFKGVVIQIKGQGSFQKHLPFAKCQVL